MNASRSAPLPAETTELLQVVGFLHLQNGHARDAMALLEACDHAGACHGRSLILLAFVRLRAGFPSKALSALERADPVTRSLSAYNAVLARCLAAAGRHDDARQAMTAYAAARSRALAAVR
ncbi:hypothetical protein [Bordetella bronchialis]|uniref:Type III secretion protein n=1 Tax=Bordetella bronchialis TaxID=463025 RepID=A0A193FMH3_9BORD|nr:hypothetical protein [Bordetella bronchialis]ANN68304.1 hypothetical protein BAU06_20160 [Bordetella bronchialis]ANN73444.1 hypothetical protein BAU08_20690 [Bordetella bronchialis]